MAPWKAQLAGWVDRTNRAAFIDLVLADPDLVHAEFESIINDAWCSEPPGRTPRCAVGGVEPRRRGPGRTVHLRPTRLPTSTPHRLGRTRQRSPPRTPGPR